MTDDELRRLRQVADGSVNAAGSPFGVGQDPHVWVSSADVVALLNRLEELRRGRDRVEAHVADLESVAADRYHRIQELEAERDDYKELSRRVTELNDMLTKESENARLFARKYQVACKERDDACEELESARRRNLELAAELKQLRDSIAPGADDRTDFATIADISRRQAEWYDRVVAERDALKAAKVALLEDH